MRCGDQDRTAACIQSLMLARATAGRSREDDMAPLFVKLAIVILHQLVRCQSLCHTRPASRKQNHRCCGPTCAMAKLGPLQQRGNDTEYQSDSCSCVSNANMPARFDAVQWQSRAHPVACMSRVQPQLLHA